MLRRPHAETQYEPALLAQAEQIAYTMPAEEQEKLSKNILVVSQAFIDGVLKDADRSADFEYKTAFLSFLENYQPIDESILRQHLVLFLREVIPVAEQYGVNLCIHPDDPPFPILGLPRIVSTLSDLEWICDQVPSLHNGLTFCTGSLSVNPQNDLNAVVEKLAPRIHFAHLRNNRRTGYRTFYESGHLEGDIDMYSLLKTLLNEQRRRKASGRKDDRIPFRPDHGLTMLDDFHRSANPGYPLVGRLKGLAELSGMQLAIEKELNH
jgi:mannonate dehydratase